MSNGPPSIDVAQIGSKKIKSQRESRNRFETLQDLDDIATMSETTKDMIQQCASRVAKAINKPLKSRISSPTQALMTKRRKMVENGDDKQRLEYAEICKTIMKKARDEIRKYNQETILASQSMRKGRRKQKLGQDRLITLLDRQGREIHDQDKIIERIEELYTEPCDSEQSIIIHTDPKEIPEITPWEVEDKKTGTATSNDHKV